MSLTKSKYLPDNMVGLPTSHFSFSIPQLAVADSQFLRVNQDLMIKGADHSLVLRDYFLNPISLKITDGQVLSVNDVLSLVKHSVNPVLLAAAAEDVPGLLAGEAIGTVDKVVNGPIEIQNPQGQTRFIEQSEAVIYLHDTVITSARSYIEIVLYDGSKVQVGPLSRLSLDKYVYDTQHPEDGGEFETGILIGLFRFVSGQISGEEEKQHTTIKTPSANIGIRGSEIDLQIDDNGGTTLLFSTGLIDITTALETVSVYEPGTEIYISNDRSRLQVREATETEILETRALLAPLNPPSAPESSREDDLFKTQMIEPESVVAQTIQSPDLGAPNPFSALLPQTEARLNGPEFEQPLPPENRVAREYASEPPQPFMPIQETIVPIVEELRVYSENPIVFKEDNAYLLENIFAPEVALNTLEILPPSHGTLTLYQNGTLVYTPTDVAFNGEDHFSYRFDANSAFIPVTIPTIRPLTIPIYSANQIDDTLRANNPPRVEMTQPEHGHIIDNGDGTLTYLPEPHFHGEDSFIYRLAGEPPIRVDLMIESVNDAPHFNQISPQFTTREDTALTIPASELLENITDIEGDPFTLLAVNTEGGNILTFNELENTITFSSSLHFNGQTTFHYTVVDVQGATASNQATVTVSAVNDPPIPTNDQVALGNTPRLTIPVAQLLANDREVDGDPLQITAVQNAQNGTVSLNTSTDIITFHATDLTLNGYFEYVLTDGQENRVGQVTVQARPVAQPSVPEPVFPSVPTINNAPHAQNDGIFDLGDATQITLTTAQLLENDFDPDGDILSVIRVTDSISGTVILNQGEITFVTAEDFNGEGQFSYQISDGQGGFATAVVFLQGDRVPFNQNPLASADSFFIDNLEPIQILTETLLGNDYDPDQQTLEISAVSAERGGQVHLETDSIIFTPTADFVDQGQFTYTISDGHGGTDTATVTLILKIPVVNHPPQAIDDSLVIQNINPFTISGDTLLKNDTDMDGDPLTIVSVTEVIQGTSELSAENTIAFVPNANFTKGSFSYTISDGKGGTAVATVTIENANQNPIAHDDTLSFSTSLTASDLLENDTDPNGDALTISQVNSAINGNVSLDIASGKIVFVPAENFYQQGTGQFTYTVLDGRGGSTTANVTLVRDNTPPQAQDDVVNVSPTQPTTITSAMLLVNDSDAEHDPLTVQEINVVTSGEIHLDTTTGNILFTPNADFATRGTGTFTYAISDGLGGVATAQVTLTRTNENPIGGADSMTVSDTGAITILSTLLLANDSDPEGDPLTITAVSEAVNGQIELDSSGDLIFTPDTLFNQAGGQFTYTVTDAHGGTATTTVTLNKSQGAPPIANADTLTTEANTPLTVSRAELLENDVNPAELSIIAVSPAENGHVELGAPDTVIYTPPADFVGIDQFTYTVKDGLGATGEAVVSVMVTDTTIETVNNPPLATDDGFAKPFNVAVIIPTSELLANDGDLDLQDNLTVSAVGSPSNGVEVALVNHEVRLFIDALASENNDTAHFDYTVSDSRGATATATVTINSSNVIYATPGETVTGTDGLDIIIGSERGEEFAIGDGADLLLGRGGNDIFLLNAETRSFLIAGGEGEDTLRLQGSGQSLDLIKNNSLAEGQQLKLQGIDLIDLNGAHSLRLSVQDVLDISDEGRLFVEGDRQSFINSTGQGWDEQGIIGVNGVSYYQYLNGDATLLVSTEIEARFIS